MDVFRLVRVPAPTSFAGADTASRTLHVLLSGFLFFSRSSPACVTRPRAQTASRPLTRRPSFAATGPATRLTVSTAIAERPLSLSLDTVLNQGPFAPFERLGGCPLMALDRHQIHSSVTVGAYGRNHVRTMTPQICPVLAGAVRGLARAIRGTMYEGLRERRS